jgi:predicted transcriptional regulator
VDRYLFFPFTLTEKSDVRFEPRPVVSRNSSIGKDFLVCINSGRDFLLLSIDRDRFYGFR